MTVASIFKKPTSTPERVEGICFRLRHVNILAAISTCTVPSTVAVRHSCGSVTTAPSSTCTSIFDNFLAAHASTRTAPTRTEFSSPTHPTASRTPSSARHPPSPLYARYRPS
ncbi:hypothetical protein NUW54_g8468 [Trametes sanguinea]|uniref:Uncharacterized protein n=1 Tax=Trametes sanguinea TaxID=158606 RepID=A0ACC1PD59_9APHY|nr:hypothetical protein NUW54_g8468 [Trametes sanguinea]